MYAVSMEEQGEEQNAAKPDEDIGATVAFFVTLGIMLSAVLAFAISSAVLDAPKSEAADGFGQLMALLASMIAAS